MLQHADGIAELLADLIEALIVHAMSLVHQLRRRWRTLLSVEDSRYRRARVEQSTDMLFFGTAPSRGKSLVNALGKVG
jgi:hypothetical protein